ncbi:MAG: hypothetical protein AB1898_09175 [Acidobacteriota bacterium]
MPGENRRDYRETEQASITVTGSDYKSHSFEEQTVLRDISAVGVSFYLNAPVAPRAFLMIDVSRSRLMGYLGKRRAVVVRTENGSADKKLVAAEFI